MNPKTKDKDKEPEAIDPTEIAPSPPSTEKPPVPQLSASRVITAQDRRAARRERLGIA